MQMICDAYFVALPQSPELDVSFLRSNSINHRSEVGLFCVFEHKFKQI